VDELVAHFVLLVADIGKELLGDVFRILAVDVDIPILVLFSMVDFASCRTMSDIYMCILNWLLGNVITCLARTYRTYRIPRSTDVLHASLSQTLFSTFKLFHLLHLVPGSEYQSTLPCSSSKTSKHHSTFIGKTCNVSNKMNA